MIGPAIAITAPQSAEGADAEAASEIGRWETFSVRAPLAVLSPFEEVIRPHAAEDAHPRSLLIMGPNNSMQLTALRAAADAERCASKS